MPQDLVPDGAPQGQRQETVAKMQQLGLPLESGSSSPAIVPGSSPGSPPSSTPPGGGGFAPDDPNRVADIDLLQELTPDQFAPPTPPPVRDPHADLRFKQKKWLKFAADSPSTIGRATGHRVAARIGDSIRKREEVMPQLDDPELAAIAEGMHTPEAFSGMERDFENKETQREFSTRVYNSQKQQYDRLFRTFGMLPADAGAVLFTPDGKLNVKWINDQFDGQGGGSIKAAYSLGIQAGQVATARMNGQELQELVDMNSKEHGSNPRFQSFLTGMMASHIDRDA